MSGVNLDALSDEQLEELIAGCRTLRALRAPYLEQADAAPFSNPQDSTAERLCSTGQQPVADQVDLSPVQ